MVGMAHPTNQSSQSAAPPSALGRAGMIARFIKGSTRFFIFSMIWSIINTALNAMTPQVIRITVDSVLGDAPFSLPEWVVRLLGDSKEANLLLAAVAVLVIAVLSGVSNYLCRIDVAKGSEGFVKKAARRIIWAHSKAALPLACAAPNRRDHPALHVGCGYAAQLCLWPAAGGIPHGLFNCAGHDDDVFDERKNLFYRSGPSSRWWRPIPAFIIPK